VKLADYYATDHVEFGLLVQAAALESLSSIRIDFSCGAEYAELSVVSITLQMIEGASRTMMCRLMWKRSRQTALENVIFTC
jgi:hypothetical protein